MSDRLVPLQLPASFIIKQALPSGAEIGYGFREEWLTRKETIEVALAKYKAGMFLVPAEEELALLLSDEINRVDELASSLEFSDQPTERRARFWLLLALAWILEHQTEYDDLQQVINMLYTDFEHPNEIENLVGFMPDGPSSLDETVARSREYVTKARDKYRDRNRRWITGDGGPLRRSSE